jgi:hypothetical protein
MSAAVASGWQWPVVGSAIACEKVLSGPKHGCWAGIAAGVCCPDVAPRGRVSEYYLSREVGDLRLQVADLQ